MWNYVSYTSSKTSFTTDISRTEYSSTQVINPSKLTLWRVIRVNADGSTDLVSANLSSAAIYFQGVTEYKNLAGYLNVLASQYETEGVTSESRYFGYNNLTTPYITSSSKFTYGTNFPWQCSTGESCGSDETLGGGDDLYTYDYNLTNNAISTIVANDLSGSAYAYWTASRRY